MSFVFSFISTISCSISDIKFFLDFIELNLVLTSQLRSALIFNKEIKSANYSIDTYKKKIYIYGLAESKEEQSLVIEEAKQILDVEDVISSILLVEDLRIQKN